MFDRFEEGGDLYRDPSARDDDASHVVEQQRHAGTGKATYGVRKNKDGWWVDKSDDAFHKNEMKVKFNKKLIQRSDNANNEQYLAVRQPTLAERRMDESLRIARSRLSQSNSAVESLENDLAHATQTIKDVHLDLTRKPMSARQVANSDNRRVRVSNVANDIVEDRKQKVDEKQRFVNGSMGHGETEYPSHLRMSYENDVDYMKFMNKIQVQHERENRFARDRITANNNFGKKTTGPF